ncbi:putative polyprenol reductase 1 [Tetrabaena socialis]|uniref:Putative polyprenol reductase 1 n=1 Tax=Tetrabaena socialis TaxID=47790 RepID=A0A2J7ZSX8_9CHLO|nr:putative polyprenol reductase 1 [Tetrabaena socialis]|eukprot:PNH03372.1 putative polyprenol reductase 1 [Tetrabaena socialis]
MGLALGELALTASTALLKDLSVPQQYFEHFYIVGALVNTVLLQLYIFVCCLDEDGSTLKVCCPHYLAEILIYAALALVTRGTPCTLLIGAWVLLNLALAAGATRRFYANNFKEYPRRRAALVPGLF